MILTNIEAIPGRQIVEHYGLVMGSTIRAKHIGRDIMAGLKNIVEVSLKAIPNFFKSLAKKPWTE